MKKVLMASVLACSLVSVSAFAGPGVAVVAKVEKTESTQATTDSSTSLTADTKTTG